jgi:hypothetical protein
MQTFPLKEGVDQPPNHNVSSANLLHEPSVEEVLTVLNVVNGVSWTGETWVWLV